MAPKRLELDEAKVAELALAGASNRDIAAIIGCDESTVRSRFPAILTKQRALRRQRIREAQDKAALAGNPAMLIWLGKQELGQVDKQITTHRSEDTPKRLAIPDVDARHAAKRKG